MKVIKRDGTRVRFSQMKIESVLKKAFKAAKTKYDKSVLRDVVSEVMQYDFINDGTSLESVYKPTRETDITVEEIQDIIETSLMRYGYHDVAKHYILYRAHRKQLRDWVEEKRNFINRYKEASNNANATIDDNSNVSTKNIGTMNNESHKEDNILISRYMVQNKLKELYPDFDYKNYSRDLESHVIYKHDESSFSVPAPYCVSITMYPFLLNGIRDLGGLSAAPKGLESYCGMFVNMVYAIASQFAGAIAVGEALLYFDYYARKEWGDEYYRRANAYIHTDVCKKRRTILDQIHQYWQGIIYSINQPIASRGLQAAFVNFSYFDKPFFESMFEGFRFPDGTEPIWESFSWLQKEFMMWFNEERLKVIHTFPVESFALIYKDGKFVDEESAKFVAEEYARGHSFFTYISDSADSLSSCCFDGKTKISYNDGSNFKENITFEDAYNMDGDKTITVRSINPYTNEYDWREGRFVRYRTGCWKYITLDDGETIQLTMDHILPIRRDGKMMDCEAINIKVGDEVLFFDRVKAETDNNGIVYKKIVSIEQSRMFASVYCYCIEMKSELHPYFILANNLITHNCRLKNKVQTKEFSFTNGNMGLTTGSKSVITTNLNRIIQDWYKTLENPTGDRLKDFKDSRESLRQYIRNILSRVYKYHTAYNELLWDEYNANLLPVYKAGFIHLDKQYLTIGINGLNEAAEFLGIRCNDNPDYQQFCQLIFGTIKESNTENNGRFNGHKLTFNTECVPAESLAIKNYNWDKKDGYVVPKDRNLYASYIYIPSDESVDILEKIRLHGKNYIGDYLDGGSAAHLNLSEHLTAKQYEYILGYAAEEGCNYLTFNIPQTECSECGFITKHPIDKCPKCGGTKLAYYDRIIGYLTKIANWSDGRQKEQKTRVYESHINDFK